MRVLSSRPFCSCDGRRVSPRYLSALGRDTTRPLYSTPYLADSQRLTGYLGDPEGLPVQLDPASMPSCSLHSARTDNTLVASSSRLLDNPLLGLSILHAAGLSGRSSSPGMLSLQEA